jgi:hypothetical protein
MGLIYEKEPPKGHYAGSNKNIDDINKYVCPPLNQIGFEIAPIRGAENVRKRLKLSDAKIWSTFSKRFQKDGSGNLMSISSINNPDHSLVAQVFVIISVSEIKTRGRFNIPGNIIDSTTDNNRIQETLKALGIHDLWMMLCIRTGWWVFMKYSDIPLEGWRLTYSGKNHTRLNRMYIRLDFLQRKLIPTDELKEILQLQLLSRSIVFNK